MGAARSSGRRLPARVYWVRRGAVLLVAAALVLGIVQLVGGLGSDDAPASTTGERASTVSGEGTPQATGPAPEYGPDAVPKRLTRTGKKAAVLAAPSGECADDEVSVQPQVTKAAAGAPIAIDLQLLGTQPACSFEVSAESVVAKITSGEDRIWSTQDCPRSVPSQTVVVRSGTPTLVTLRWSGRRSDEDCSARTAWAMPGFYHVFAAATGSAPTDVQFEVTLPSRPVVTRTAKPKPTATTSPSASATRSAAKPARPKPSATPTR